MSVPDPGHLGPDPRPRRRGRLLLVLVPVMAVVALVLAFLPIGSYVAGLPALAAIVLAVVALSLGTRRLLPALSVAVSVAALVIAVVVSAGQLGEAAGRFAESLPELDDVPTPAPTAAPDQGDGGSGPGTTDALGAGEHRVIYEVLGGGTARVTYSAFLGAQSGTSSEDEVEVPHRRTQRVTVEDGGSPARFTMIVSRTAATDAALGCRITIDDRVVAERRPSTSQPAVPLAVCAAEARP